MPLEQVLQIKQLSKNYGRITALKDLSIEVGPGHVFGILGPNGSGKTTTLSIITGVISPDSGSFSWFGKIPVSAIRKKIGSLIEVPNFYPYLDLHRNLLLVARIKGKPPGDIGRVLRITGLWERRKSRYDTLSLGMKQRLSLASVLLGDPEVLVLDEPANGLDPEGISEVRDIIRQEAEKKKTIIMASHILDEVEKVCSHVAVLKKGSTIAQGRVHELLAAEDPVIAVCSDAAKLEEELIRSGMTSSVKREGDELSLVLKPDYNAGDVNRMAFEKGMILTHLQTRKKSLEAQFLELVK